MKVRAVVLSVCVLMPLLSRAAEPVAGAAGVGAGVRPAVEKAMAARKELPVSLRREVDAAIGRGLDWLAAQQSAAGAWSNTNFPALTAMAMESFIDSTHPKRAAVLAAAERYVLSCVRPDGGIYREVDGRKGGGLSNYNTAICMTALHRLGKGEHDAVVLAARKFVAQGQHRGDDIYRGGFGYDARTDRAYTDLLNTYYVARGMRQTEDVEKKRSETEARVDIDWKETLAYVERLQNRPETGPEDAGGFVYNPSDPKAGTRPGVEGKPVFRSYGSITYAGMLAMVYARLEPSDPRVRSALHWAHRRWSLEENPGMGKEGLYFFYNVLVKALSATGHGPIPRPEGKTLDWREEVARKLVQVQKVDAKTGGGYWINDTGRYWENDPALCTAYAIQALQLL